MCLQIVLSDFALKKDIVIYFSHKSWISPFWVGVGVGWKTEAFVFNRMTEFRGAVDGHVPKQVKITDVPQLSFEKDLDQGFRKIMHCKFRGI